MKKINNHELNANRFLMTLAVVTTLASTPALAEQNEANMGMHHSGHNPSEHRMNHEGMDHSGHRMNHSEHKKR